MDTIIQPESIHHSRNHAVDDKKNTAPPVDDIDNQSTQNQAILDKCVQAISSSQLANNNQSFKNFSEKEARSIIDGMPDMVLAQYVDKFMAKSGSDAIVDKRQFAERAIEELYKPNDSTPLTGEIKLAYNIRTPSQSIATDVVPKNAKLYAHLNTFGKTPTSPYVFVKWVDNTTGQILLFEKKDVLADRATNWVSMQPYDGWHAGSYDIKFYQFTSALEPIAQLTYSIQKVTE